MVAFTNIYLFLDGISSDELKLEIDIMKSIDHHPNIIALFGCNTLYAPSFILMELAQFGDLDKYLKAKLEKVYWRFSDIT